ncbi:MAG: alpha/beta fold hydrolase [Jatrophihabitantaceae bacterium]
MPRSPARIAPAARLSDETLPALDLDAGPWPAHSVSVGGVELNVRHTPAQADGAEPALLVHGLGGAATNWTDFAALIRDRVDSEAIDLPGFGGSGAAVGNDYSLPAHARTVIGYLEQSQRGPVHLVGNSMGGAICIMVAAQRPDLVRTLSLVSPAVPDIRLRLHPLRHDPRMALIVVPGIGGLALRRMGRVAVEKRVRATIALCFADPTRYPPQRLAEAAEEARERMAMPWANVAFLRSVRGLVRSQFMQGRAAWTAMRQITAPTLVLWGDTDRLVAPDLAPHVAGAIADSRLLVLDDIGHTAMMEDPQTSARAFLALLEDNPQQTRS